MPVPVALQIYTVRDSVAADFEGVVRKVAEIGYAGLELGVKGTMDDRAARLYRELGLEIPSTHGPLPLGEEKNEVLDTMARLGCKRLGTGPGGDDCRTVDRLKAYCDRVNEGWAVAKANGLSLHIHNHWWEFLPLEGSTAHQRMRELLAPEICFQVDTYWVQTGGGDPAMVVRELGARAPLLHIKDGPRLTLPAGTGADYESRHAAMRKVWGESPGMTAVGEGTLDFPGIVAAGTGKTEWLIVEMDKCPTDMMEAVRKSYDYLTGKGLARGRKG
jgi:sugar phosphate isomerase/epimerase